MLLEHLQRVSRHQGDHGHPGQAGRERRRARAAATAARGRLHPDGLAATQAPDLGPSGRALLLRRCQAPLQSLHHLHLPLRLLVLPEDAARSADKTLRRVPECGEL